MQVRLNPHDRVHEMCELAPTGSDALEDEHGGISWHLDRTGPVALIPRRWAVRNGSTATQRLENSADEQIRPTEERVPPGNVVGVHRPRARDHAHETGSDRGLATGAATVDRDDAGTRAPCSRGIAQQSIRDPFKRLDPPWPGDGFIAPSNIVIAP